MHRWARLGILGIGLLGACADAPRPDLHRLYSFDSIDDEQSPVIVIPGILGSRLRAADGREIWPGSAYQVLFGNKDRLALTIDAQTLEPVADGVTADDLFDALLGRDFYGQLLQTLEVSGGYRRTRAGTPIGDARRRYYVFAYDWRQDNVVTARKLDALIEQIRRDYGQPDLRVDIVAHSMGGLVTRYYLRYGTEDVLDDNQLTVNYLGAGKVRTVVLLGTPNLGSVRALHGFLVGEELGLSRVSPEVLATMPSVYELFPHPLNDWLATADGRVLERDLFDVALWRRFQWSVFDPEIQRRMREDTGVDDEQLAVRQGYFAKRLERARRFVWALTRELDDSPERLVVFGGDCTMTPARLVVEEIDDESQVRLFPQDVKTRAPGVDLQQLMLEPGDGQVTKASLLARENLNPAAPRHRYAFFPMAYALFLCEEHNRLTGNLSFQDNLLNVLLTRERPFDQRAAPPAAGR